MNPLLKEITRNPLLWLLAFVPVVFVADHLVPEAPTLLFVLSILAIVPLAVLISYVIAPLPIFALTLNLLPPRAA